MMDSYHYGLFYNAIAAANGNDEIKIIKQTFSKLTS